MPVWVRSFNGSRCEGSSVLYEMRGRLGTREDKEDEEWRRGSRATERMCPEAPNDPQILGTFYVYFKAIHISLSVK